MQSFSKRKILILTSLVLLFFIGMYWLDQNPSVLFPTPTTSPTEQSYSTTDQSQSQLLGVTELDFWGVAEGYSLTIDSTGFSFPSAIAFVPDPGTQPDDPLYFVTELRGTIKVVTNDRTVHVFVSNFYLDDETIGLTGIPDEFGLAGICLDAQTGDVYATFVAPNETGKRYNHIYRFVTGSPGTFAVKPIKTEEFTHIFDPYTTGISHQVGTCQVVGDQFFVSVGDGWFENDFPIALNIPQGKILRFTLDGQPYPTNPFFQPSDTPEIADYVYAYGFRNPFGILWLDGELYAGDNGLDIERFIHVKMGQDYRWDGTDFSIGSIGDAYFRPTIGSGRLIFVHGGDENFSSEHWNMFFIASTSAQKRGLTILPYDLDQQTVRDVPSTFLQFLNIDEARHEGSVSAAALGPGGLYFAPLISGFGEISSVIRITYDPPNEHPLRVDSSLGGPALIANYGCTSCHLINGTGGTIGPSLEYEELIPNLTARLSSEDYLASLEELDAIDDRLYIDSRDDRQVIRDRQNKDDLLLRWMVMHLLNPAFDLQNATMPQLGITLKEARIISRYLLHLPQE